MATIKYSEDGKVLIEACDIEGHFVVPKGVTEIGDNAFFDCTTLTNIEMPDSVTKIGDWAFAGCDALIGVKIPDSVTEIGRGAFSECHSLTNIDIPNSVTKIGDWIFSGCESIREPIIVGNSFVKLPESFENSYSIPSGVRVILDRAFCDCKSLMEIILPNSVTEIGAGAFYRCSALTNIKIPDSVTKIGVSAFYECSALASVEIPDSIVSIPAFCFHATGLRNVFIHKKVERIGNHAFCNCPIEYYEVDADNPNYTSKDGVLMNKAQTMIIKFPAGKETDFYMIPSRVRALGDCTFKGSLLQLIIIGKGLKSLGTEQTFARCERLETIIIQKGICTLTKLCFNQDVNLQKVHLPNTISKIDYGVFSHCDKLTEIHLRVKDPYSITVDDNAFKDFDRSQCTLYVPIGTGYAYRHHPVFGKFKEVIIER